MSDIYLGECAAYCNRLIRKEARKSKLIEQEQKVIKKMNYFVEHTEEPRRWEFAPIRSQKVQTAIL